jgi:hypothetical protein
VAYCQWRLSLPVFGIKEAVLDASAYPLLASKSLYLMYQPTCRQNEGVVLDASFYLLAASRGDTGRFTLPVGCIKEVALDASAYLLSPSKSWYLTLQPTYHVSGIKGEALDASGCIKGWY